MTLTLADHARRGLRLDFPAIDVHAHVGKMSAIDGPALEEQVREMDRLGVRSAAVSSTLAISGEIRRGNDEVASALKRFPGRFLGYAHVSASFPELILSELQRCFVLPDFCGIKLYQVGTAFDHPAFAPVWPFARERGVPVLAHTWGGNLTGLDKVAEKNPQVPFLLGHSGSGFAYEPYIETARRLPNVYLDLTYSREHTNMIEHMVSTVGAARVVWGSDAPCFSMSHQLSKLLFARLPDADKKTILHDNPVRLFRLA